MVLLLLLLRNKNTSNQQAVKAQVEAEAKIRICSTTRVMDVEEDNRILKVGGDMEIKIQVLTGNKIQVLMYNVGVVEKKGHISKDCPKKRANTGKGKKQQNNYASLSRNNDDDHCEQLFVIQHMMDY